MGSFHVPIRRVYHSKTNPSSRNSTLESLPFAQGPTEGTPEVMRCKHGVLFASFLFFQVPTWRAAHVAFHGTPSGAQVWNRRSLVSGHSV